MNVIQFLLLILLIISVHFTLVAYGANCDSEPVLFFQPVPGSQCHSCHECMTCTNVYGLCKCDRDCHIYGDCCGPLRTQPPPTCDGHNTTSASEGESMLFSCESIIVNPDASSGENDSFWMVSVCSSNWFDEIGEGGRRTMDACINSSMGELPPATDIPTGTVYKNQHCALCNHAERTVIWRSMLYCSEYFSTLVENNKGSIVGINVTIIQEECEIAFYIPPKRAHIAPRTCLSTISSCLNRTDLVNLGFTYTPEEFEILNNDCLNGAYDLREGSDFKSYRNHACAKCNGINLTVCYRIHRIFPHIPFTITLENLDGGLVTVEHSRTKSEIITINCPEGQTSIGFECRDTLCPDNFVSVDGRCLFQPKSSNISLHNDSDSFFLDCPTKLVALNDTEFTYLKNNTVVVDGTEISVLGYTKNGQPLVCPDNVTRVAVNNNIYSYPVGFLELTYTGCSLSVIGSAMVLITYGLFKELQTFPSKVLMNLAFANLVTNLLILFGGPVVQAFPIIQLCTAVAICLHFLFLAQFAWMSLMSFEVARKLYCARKLAKDSNKEKLQLFIIYMFTGWGLPLLVSTTTVVVNFTTGFVLYGVSADGTIGSCWINHRESIVIAFVLPLVISLFFNLVMFIIVIIYILLASRLQSKLNKQGNVPFFGVTIAVFSVTGLTWIFGFIAILASARWAWYLFIIFNSTQGFVIFVTFILKKKVLKLYVSQVCDAKDKVSCFSSKEITSKKTSAVVLD